MASPLSSTAQELPEVPQPGDVIAGKYTVEGVVGSGGMGVVLSARHLTLRQAVAIKVLRVHSDDERRPEATSRFLREGQAAAGLESDHVVRIHDVGTLDNGLPFMVMELLRGEDLASALSKHGQLPVEVAVEYVLQACDAVAEAHQSGIVHRDLKPSNLFATQRSDGSALIKVLDFGISKNTRHSGDLEGDLTATRTVLGSPFYMSPEQIRNARKVDHRTDIWSLGTILHELLSGKPPFEGDTLPGICAAIVADPPAALRGARPEVPVELEQVVLRCLEKDPTRRLQTIEDLMLSLFPFGAKPSGRPNSRPESGRKRVEPPPARISLPGAITVPADAPDPLIRDMTLQSEDVIRGTPPPSARRQHAHTSDAVHIASVKPRPEKAPRGAAIFVGVSLLIGLGAASYGLLSASAPTAPAPALASQPSAPTQTRPPQVAPQSAPAAAPVAKIAEPAAPPPTAEPPASAHPKNDKLRSPKPKLQPAPAEPAASPKPPTETDIRLER